MKFFAIFLMLAVVTGCSSVPKQDCKAFQDYDLLTEAITREFYDRTFRGLNWNERVGFYRNLISCADTEPRVAATVNKLMGELHASHSQVFTRDDIAYWGFRSIFARSLELFRVRWPGLWPVRQDDGWYVRYALPGTVAYEAGVRAGDKLIALDGQEFRPMSFAEKSTLTLSHDGKTQQTVSVATEELSVQETFLRATAKSESIFKTGRKKIGYFHLWSGTHEGFLLAQNAALARFKKAKVKGLILDYRYGFGGADPEYLKMLREDPVLSKLPKIFLINEGTRSGKEWLAAIVKRDKLGHLVGTKTAGAFLAGGLVELNDDRYLLYLAKRDFNLPDIPKIEGIGVTPDVEVEGCDKFCGDRDLQLERALAILK